MTKLKSKKMTKSTLAIIIMGIAIVALLAFGGTFAYFTASSTAKTGIITTGQVLITDNATIITTALMPGDKIISAASVTPSTTDENGQYVAVAISITLADAQWNSETHQPVAGLTFGFTGVQSGWVSLGTVYSEDTDSNVWTNVFLYGTKTTASEKDTYAATVVAKNNSSPIAFVAGDGITFNAQSQSTDNTPGTFQGVSLTVSFQSKSYQASNVSNTVTAGSTNGSYYADSVKSVASLFGLTLTNADA